MSTPQEISRRASSKTAPADHHYLRWLFICDDILRRVKRDKPGATAVDYEAIEKHLGEAIEIQRLIIERSRRVYGPESDLDAGMRMKATLENIRPMTEVHLPALRALYDQDPDTPESRQACDCIDRMIVGVGKLTGWVASLDRMKAIVDDIHKIISSPGYEPKYLG